jgi:GTPase SAR1 family protein
MSFGRAALPREVGLVSGRSAPRGGAHHRGPSSAAQLRFRINAARLRSSDAHLSLEWTAGARPCRSPRNRATLHISFMGFCGSNRSVDPEAQRQGARLAREIREAALGIARAKKLLLLGAGESGKSTVFKQIRILNTAGYSESELQNFRYIIHRNVLDAIKILAEQVNAMEIELLEANEDMCDQVLLWDSESLNPEMAEVIAQLWADPGMQKCYERRNEFHINENTPLFFSDVKRIGAVDYIPTTSDALNARVRTSGVVSKEFELDGHPYLMYDVGGQRSERRKWLPLFDHVTAIVFVAAISEYDLVVAEDRSKNRLQEALDLFKQIANSKHFKDAHIILFLNKKDLFEEKIAKIDPKKWFPDYKGGCNYASAEQYFKDSFLALVEDPKKLIFQYTTCATDTKNVSVVLDSIKGIMAQEGMQSAGMG